MINDKKYTRPRTITESQIDESIIETFPASDPPSWTLGVEPRKARAKYAPRVRRRSKRNRRAAPT